MRRRARWLLPAALAAALGLAACGGGGGGSSTSTTNSGPTHAQYAAAANAICATARSQTGPLITKIKAEGVAAVLTGSGALAASVKRLHDVAAANLAKLRALVPPAGERAAITRFLGPLAAVVTQIGKAAAALAGHQAINAVALIEQAKPLAARVTSAARAFGAGRCGSVLAALS